MIPNCNKIPNSSLCKLLTLNPSLLSLDISNKLSPSIDQQVMRTLVHSCRYLTMLKLSDYRLDDPNNLLVLCGRVAVSTSKCSTVGSNSSMALDPTSLTAKREQGLLNSDTKGDVTGNMERLTNMPALVDNVAKTQQPRDGGSYAENEYVTVQSNDSDASADNVEGAAGNGTWAEEKGYSTKEEEENKGVQRDASQDGSEARDQQDAESADVDLYEDDSTVSALEVEDHSLEFGCLELETLWLENVNLTDQVAAVLLQSLPHLRDINLSDTDICNPWRLMDKSRSVHLRSLVDLDVKSTALSRTALQMIPDFHPGLLKLAISSTTLPPPTYGHVAKLTAIAELELIGGQFYPCEPEEIFTNGIMPAVSGVGLNLQSLNLTYFAHVEFTKVILSCPVIRHLDLSHTDIFLTCPCPSVGRHCPNLTSLNLGYAHIEAKDASGQFIAEEEVTQQMIGECLVLEELHLCGLTVTDDGVRTMYPGGEYPLKTLNLSRCKKLTIAGIRYLWDKCQFLNNVDMTHCKEVSVADYKAFVENCRETRPIFRLEGTVEWK